MKLVFDMSCSVLSVIIPQGTYIAPNMQGDSNLLYKIKNMLNENGAKLIKKRMWKDGHLVDDTLQYIRPVSKGANINVIIFDTGNIYCLKDRFVDKYYWGVNNKIKDIMEDTDQVVTLNYECYLKEPDNYKELIKGICDNKTIFAIN